MKKVMTLCLVCGDEGLLLGYKKRGFGAGRWNGFGGKVEEGETILEAALREVREEAGIEPLNMREVGVLEFSFESDPKVLEVHLFKAQGHSGTPIETEEMRPEWFALDAIPLEQMWSSDAYWMSLLLDDKLFTGRFLFDRPSDPEYSAKIISHELREVDTL